MYSIYKSLHAADLLQISLVNSNDICVDVGGCESIQCSFKELYIEGNLTV